MYTIYLVDDEKNLNDLLTFHLQNEGWNVKSFYSGMDVLEHIQDKVDLWILDIMMPQIDGFTLIKKVKEYNPEVPVIFISARDSDIDRVVGLEFGSEDYITKPFLPRELILRINKILSRKNIDKKTTENKLIGSECEIIYENRLIKKNARTIEFTSKEYDLIEVFTKNENKAFSREELLDLVWGRDYFGSDRVVDDLVRRVRKKLPEFDLETVYGYGYRWCGYE